VGNYIERGEVILHEGNSTKDQKTVDSAELCKIP